MLATTQGLVCHTPAKLNLYFELIACRDDGYHDVETLMVPVSLYDTLTFQSVSDGLEKAGKAGEIEFLLRHGFRSSGSSFESVPADRSNLVVRALELLQQRSGIDRGAQVTLLKRIPSQAGLGGGSSDAAAALKLANVGWGLEWSEGQLMELATELGSDVPFFLSPRTAIGRGRGEQLERLQAAGRLYAVVIVPPEGLSTADVYRASRVPSEPKHIQTAIGALQSGSLRHFSRGLHNRLEQAARTLSPWIDRLRHAMNTVGCQRHQMTGSGSGYFGLCRHMEEARQMAHKLRARNVGRVFAVRCVG